MKLNIKIIALLQWSLAIGVISSGIAQAQAYPDRPVRIVVPFPAGGASGNIGQLLAQRLSAAYGASFVLDYRVGSGGAIAGEHVAKSPPNGYTLLFATGALNINDVLRKTKRYEFAKELDPIIEVAQAPFVMLVNPKLPVNNVREFTAYARANPGKLNYGSGGLGAVTHLAGEMYKVAAGIDMVHVPFNGEAPAIVALMGEQVQVAFMTLAASSGQIAARTLKPLAVLSPQRSALAPDVPTMAEEGLDVIATTWYALMAPAGTPAPIIERLNAEAAKALADPDLRSRITGMGAVPSGGSIVRLKDLISSDRVRWRKLSNTTGITLD